MYQSMLRKQRSGIPIMKNNEINTHAVEFLPDYSPYLLKMPHPVDIETFAEFYLDLALDYAYLSHYRLILDRMVFQEAERGSDLFIRRKMCGLSVYKKRHSAH